MRRRSQGGIFAVALLSLLFVSSTVYAEEALEAAPNKDVVKKVEEHNRKGIEYYKAGQLPEAVQEMLEAYHLIPSNDLLYNIARIYQKMGEYGLALKYFQDYVTARGVKPANVKKALEKMAEIRGLQKENQRRELIPASPPPQVPVPVAPAPEPVPKAEPKQEDPVTPTDISEAGPLEEPGIPTSWMIGGTGGGLVVLGAVFGLAASSAFGDFEAADTDIDKLDAQGRTENWSTLADVSYVLGVGAIAGAIVWKYVVEEKDEVAVRVVPAVFDHGFGMQVIVPLFE